MKLMNMKGINCTRCKLPDNEIRMIRTSFGGQPAVIYLCRECFLRYLDYKERMSILEFQEKGGNMN